MSIIKRIKRIMKSSKNNPKFYFSRQEFINFVMDNGIVKIGDFTLKSGKKSKVFFNFGVVDTGKKLSTLGAFFASYIVDNYLDCENPVDTIYGPAYKGINLALATSIALYNTYGVDIPFLYDRKEVKSHGEKGSWVGSTSGKNVLIIDDVITDCATKHVSIEKLGNIGLNIKGILVGIDREEFNQETQLSYAHDFYDNTGIDILSLCRKSDIFI